MDETNKERLADIETITHLMEIAPGETEQAILARQQLVMLYYGAAYRYLLGSLHDQEAAQDLAQQFAIRFMQGDFVKKADRDKGRFRDYLKRSLQNAVNDYYRKTKGKVVRIDDQAVGDPQQDQVAASDEVFLNSLRDELISCTWKNLFNLQKETGTPYETVLRLKTQQPRTRSAQIAEQLSQEMDRSFTEGGVRQILRRARDKFADFLVDNVEKALRVTDDDTLMEQLADLKLLEFCKPALEKRK